MHLYSALLLSASNHQQNIPRFNAFIVGTYANSRVHIVDLKYRALGGLSLLVQKCGAKYDA